MKNRFKIAARPKLNKPNMLAAWPGISNVSILVAGYLSHKLDFKDLAELEAPYFFDPIGVSVKDNVVEAPQFPQTKFYYWKNPRRGSDLILLIGDDQPATKSYDLANTVLDMAVKFEVQRVYTCAAAMTRMHHTEPSRVFGVASSPHVARDLKKYELALAGNLQIAGLNGLLLGVAKERGIEGMCLLGEVPSYTTRLQNPMAALAVLRALTKILNIPLDLGDMEQTAQEAAERMKQVAAQAMGDYIDYFTEPIWERGEEGEEGEEDEAEEG